MNPLRELRKRKGITQTELGHVLNVQKSAISKYELGRATPSSDILKKLSEYFDVSINYILGANFHKAEQQPSTDLINFLNQSEVIFNGVTYKLNNEDRQKAIAALERIFLDIKTHSTKKSAKK